MGERHSEYARDANDWYVEPDWAVQALIDAVRFDRAIHDPCCGCGTIPKIFIMNGIPATGSDIVDRGFGFQADAQKIFYPNETDYVANPPYGIAQSVIEHLLVIASGRVAALVQTKFLSSQRRQKLFQRPDMETVLIFSKRPSMPPGELLMREGEKCRGGGSIDFCWCVWDTRRTFDAATIRWIP